MIRFGHILFVFLAGAIIFSCKKAGTNQNVQSNCTISQATQTPVNFTILAGSGQFFPLNTIGGYIYVANVGIKGIIVFRATSSQFIALERSCTKDGCDITKAKVWFQAGNACKDSTCGSIFSASDGSVQTGPATIPLYQYHTNWDGNQLHVYN